MTTSPWVSATAENVRAVMARKRKRGTELARVLHLSQTAASRRMNGQTPIHVDELISVAEWLNVPVTDLLPETASRLHTRGYRGRRATVGAPALIAA